VAGWDWAKFKAPVAVMTDAGLELIDGQHTAIAAATHPEIATIPVMIVDVDKRAERAAAFIGHNRDRVAVDAQITPLTQIEIKAINLLLYGSDYQGQISDVSLVSTIGTMGRKAYSEAHVFRAAHPSVPLWKALAITWFKNRRSKPQNPSSSGPIAVRTPSNRVEKINTAVSGHGEATGVQSGSPAAFEKRRGLPMSSYMTPKDGTDLKTASGKLIENITHRPPNPVAISQQKPPVVDSGKVDARPKLNGWVPGRFLLRCSGCDEKYQGDRKSRSCADCAYGCTEVMSA